MRKLSHMGLITEDDFKNEIKNRHKKESAKNQEIIKMQRLMLQQGRSEHSPVPRISKID